MQFTANKVISMDIRASFLIYVHVALLPGTDALPGEIG